MKRSLATTLLAVLVTASSAQAQSPAPSASAGGFTGAPTTPPPTVSVTGPVSLQADSSALLGGRLAVHGRAPSADARRQVVVQRLDARRGQWRNLATAATDAHGAFSLSVRPTVAGDVTVRAVVVPHGRAAAAAAAASSPPVIVTVYRPALATVFGPGFYGKRTACGQTLTSSTVGVASRTLPCGTLVRFLLAGRTLEVPVIDRGPYANGADWDLTTGAATALGAGGTVRVGTVLDGRLPNSAALGQPAGAPSTASSPGTTGGTSASG